MKNKKILLIVICSVLAAAVIVTVFVIGYRDRKSKGAPEDADRDGVVAVESLEEAAERAGFPFACSDRLNGMPATAYSADRTVITVTFGSTGYITKTLIQDEPESEENAEPAEGEDAGISLALDGRTVRLTGEEDAVSKAEWTENGFEYVICLTGQTTTANIMSEYILATR